MIDEYFELVNDYNVEIKRKSDISFAKWNRVTKEMGKFCNALGKLLGRRMKNSWYVAAVNPILMGTVLVHV